MDGVVEKREGRGGVRNGEEKWRFEVKGKYSRSRAGIQSIGISSERG
jgi:hypothetical protein